MAHFSLRQQVVDYRIPFVGKRTDSLGDDANNINWRTLSDEEWKKRLDPEAWRILRCKGTERAFTGVLYHEKRPGSYLCGACDQKLFDAAQKYDSGSGWPSWYAPVSPDVVEMHEDQSLHMTRIEVCCKRCGSHLGHVFDDGPEPTGLRWCINSKSLKFKPES